MNSNCHCKSSRPLKLRPFHIRHRANLFAIIGVLLMVGGALTIIPGPAGPVAWGLFAAGFPLIAIALFWAARES
ncbi:MAG TPA: hypothetical protein VH598_09800 [Verrucomicrobiae bacterium]|nr:hypothetical protein [Verrucomicrobiae bacterium]